MGLLSIYGCGGCGTNISKQIKDLDCDVNYIDTSTSNLKGVKSDNIFILDDIDGAGKDRSKTYEHFKHLAEDVLIKFKPSGNLNVVISSLSGGSGSVISPFITKELIEGGYNTIVIGVDSRNSLKEIDNSVKSLKSFKAISDKTKKPISMFYIENTSRKESDDQAIMFITLLSLIINKNHTEEFDVSDLSNFINFDRVTDNTPTVTMIEINGNDVIVPEKNTSVVSTILVTKDKNSSIKPVIPEYLSTCIVTDPNYSNEDIRLDNVLGRFAITVEELEEQMKELKDNKKISKFRDVTVDESTDDGIVL